eukprot:jgi/Botrbrau1/2462/Bobra.0226s0021.1
MENNEYLPAVEFGAAIEKGLSRVGVPCAPAPTSAIANSTNKFANQPGGMLSSFKYSMKAFSNFSLCASLHFLALAWRRSSRSLLSTLSRDRS